MIETRRLENVVIFIQTVLSFVLSRKLKNYSDFINRKTSLDSFLLKLNFRILSILSFFFFLFLKCTVDQGNFYIVMDVE